MAPEKINNRPRLVLSPTLTGTPTLTPAGTLTPTPVKQTTDVQTLPLVKPQTGSRENFQRTSGTNYANSLDEKTRKTIQDKLKKEYEKLQVQLKKTRKENGPIGNSWDWIKNVTGLGAGSNKVQAELDKMKKQLADLEKHPANMAKVYKSITGKNLNSEELAKLTKGQIETKASIALDKYQEGQSTAVDTVADVISGIAVIGVYTAAVAAAPFTGFASIAVGIAAAGVVAGGLKAGIKYADAKIGGRKYDSLGYDLATGFLNGAMAPVTGGLGGALGKTVAFKLGVRTAEEIAEEVVEQTVKRTTGMVFKEAIAKLMVNPAGYEYVGGKLLGRVAAIGTEMAVDGSLSGGFDNALRAGLDGKNVVEGFANGFVGGLVAAPIIGGGFRLVGRAGKKLGEAIKGDAAVNELTEGISTTKIIKEKEASLKNTAIEEHNTFKTNADEELKTNAVNKPIAMKKPELIKQMESIKNRNGVAILNPSDIPDIIQKIKKNNHHFNISKFSQMLNEITPETFEKYNNDIFRSLIDGENPSELLAKKFNFKTELDTKYNDDSLNRDRIKDLFNSIKSKEQLNFAKKLSENNVHISYLKDILEVASDDMRLQDIALKIKTTPGYSDGQNLCPLLKLAKQSPECLEKLKFITSKMIEIDDDQARDFVERIDDKTLKIIKERNIFGIIPEYNHNFVEELASVSDAQWETIMKRPELLTSGAMNDISAVEYFASLNEGKYSKIIKYNLLNKKIKAQDLHSLFGHVDDDTFDEIAQRGLLSIEGRKKLFSSDEMVKLAGLGPDEWPKAKKLLYIAERGDKQFSGYQILNLAKLEPEAWAKAEKLFYIEGRGLNQFDYSGINDLIQLKPEEWARAEKLIYLPKRDNEQFSITRICSLIKRKPEEWTKIEKSVYIEGRGDKQFDYSEICKLAELDSDQWTRAQRLIYVANRGNDQFNANDICCLANSSDEILDKVLDITSNKAKDNYSIKATDLANLLSFDKKNESFKSKVEVLEMINEIESHFSPDENKLLFENLDPIAEDIQKDLMQTITPMNVSKEAKVNFCKKFLANNNPNVERMLREANFESFGKNGIPLEYSRSKFIGDLNEIIANLSETQKANLFKKLEITVKVDSSGKINAYDGILNLNDLDTSNQLQKQVHDLVNKFTYGNKVVTGNSEFDETLNALIKAFPEFINIIGKQPHTDANGVGAHAYSLDVHILTVLKTAMNNPKYAKLTNQDKTIMKFATLFHDIAKEEGMIDKNHPHISALYVRNLVSKFNLPIDIKDRVFSLVKNHHWLEEFNEHTATMEDLATRFRKPQDYLIAKIMADADLNGIGDESFREYLSALSDENQKSLVDALEKIYNNGNIILPSKIVHLNKIPDVIYNGNKYRVINFTQKGLNLNKVGFYGIKNLKDLRFLVHMLPEDSLLRSAQTTDLLSDIANGGVLSTSLISLKNKITYKDRKYGLVLDFQNSNIANALSRNQASDYGKDFNKFVSLLNSFDDEAKTFLKKNIINKLKLKYGTLTDEEYGLLYKQIINKKFTTQIDNKEIFDIGRKSISGKDLKKALLKAQDELFIDAKTSHNEIVVYNPKISAVVCKESSLDKVPQEMLDFAESKNLPIYLIGE